MSSATSVLLVDDHGLVRHGLQLLLIEAIPGLHVRACGSLADAVEALAKGGRFDLVLLDLTLEDVHGIAGLMRLRGSFPYVPVVIVSAQDDRDTVMAALQAGAMGFISKSAAPDELRQAMREVLVERRIHLPQSVSADAVHRRDQPGRGLDELARLGLTERQIEVLGLVVQGWRNKEIAQRLAISEVMVKKHITPALQAIGVADRTKLLVALSRQGYSVPSVLAPQQDETAPTRTSFAAPRGDPEGARQYLRAAGPY